MANRPSEIYLDYNASAPARPQVIEAVAEALGDVGNPSSVHRAGRAARARIDKARRDVASLVGGSPAGVIFTSGGSEANNLALKGFRGHRLLISAGEHDSIINAVPSATRIPLLESGLIDLEALRRSVGEEKGPFLLSLMWANNETGVIQPVGEAAKIVHEAGGLMHSDAVQAAGKLEIDMTASRIDLLSLSAHKLGGPQGVGALILREGLDIAPLIKGGGQERSRRAGTENAAGIAGFGVAAGLAKEGIAGYGELAELRDCLEVRLKEAAPGIKVYGEGEPRLANTSCFGLRGMKAETLVMALDLAGVAVSAGSACSSGKVRPSHVLQAMGADEEDAGAAIRLSLGWASKAGDLEQFLDAWLAHYQRSQAA